MILSIDDLRELAKKRIPRAIFDYAAGGAYEERTLLRNSADLDAMTFRQRVMVDVSNMSLASTLVGTPVSMPLAIGPTGLAGLFHADGEILAARAAAACGIPYCMSTMSICSIEDVRAASQQPFWFQQYLMKDRGFNQELIDRAAAAQCSALMLTLDLQVLGERRRLGHSRCCLANGAHSVIWSGESAVRAVFVRCQSGPRRSSMRPRIGATWNGSEAAGLES